MHVFLRVFIVWDTECLSETSEQNTVSLTQGWKGKHDPRQHLNNLKGQAILQTWFCGKICRKDSNMWAESTNIDRLEQKYTTWSMMGV